MPDSILPCGTDGMISFWRLLKGVWPYRFWLVVSFLCAIGVSLSYASGVATLYPVLKIFISTEGVHGWADQRVADSRLAVQTLNLGATATRGSLAINLIKVLPAAPAALKNAGLRRPDYPSSDTKCRRPASGPQPRLAGDDGAAGPCPGRPESPFNHRS